MEDELLEAHEMISELVSLCTGDKRTPCPLADLVVGMKCGGSDGFSGLTANPLLGQVSDELCSHGGTVLLTEVPEMFGAEKILMNRAESEDTFQKIVALINNFKQYYLDHQQTVYENPSPGNIESGISTLEEKSMGAIQKGGTSSIREVLEYGEICNKNGLSLIRAPGNDAISSTALVASGATVILFTTGRGTPMGFPAPTIKIASNSNLAQRKPNWIDFDAFPIIEGGRIQETVEEFITLILNVSSGRTVTKSEKNCLREIAIWKHGITL